MLWPSHVTRKPLDGGRAHVASGLSTGSTPGGVRFPAEEELTQHRERVALQSGLDGRGVAEAAVGELLGGT